MQFIVERRGYRLLPLIALAIAAALLVLLPGDSQATHALGLFELDENATNGAAAGDDWDQVYNGTSSAARTVFVADGDDFSGGVTVPAGLPADDTSYFTTGGSKDVNDINQWRHQTGDVAPDKDEILNAYAAAYLGPDGSDPGTDPDLILYFGLDRLANNGDAQVGFWFFQSTHSLNPDGTFSGVHQVGDILVLSHFTQGGSVDTIEVYKWVGPPDADNLLQVATGVDCGSPHVLNDPCATVNNLTEDAPWPYVAKAPVKGQSANDFAPSSFYEGGINTATLGLDIGCGGSFLAETRSSQSLDAQLKDFALGDFSLCSIDVTKTPRAENVCEGTDNVTYDYLVTNTGVVALNDVTAVDDNFTPGSPGDDIALVLSGLTDEDGDGTADDLAVGGSATATRTVTLPAGTHTNVVTATGHVGTASVSDTDDATVNVFTCDIEVTKSVNPAQVCEDRDQVVTYTFHVINAGNIALTDVTVNDTVLGNLTANFVAANGGSSTLAVGADISFTVNHTVNATTNNTVTAQGNALGLSPADTDSASATVTAFDCDIEVTKSVNPAQVCADRDQVVTYTFHVINAGNIALTDVTVNDTVLGNLTANFVAANGGSSTLAVGADISFTVNHTVNATTNNTVTAQGNALGLSPADTDSASATVTAYSCTIDVTKVCVNGSPITFSGTVTNTGTAALLNVTAVDDNGTPGNPADDFVLTLVGLTDVDGDTVADDLAPGGSATYAGSYSPPVSPSTNTVTATGAAFTPDGQTALGVSPSDSASATCEVPNKGCTPGFWQGGAGILLWNEGPPDPDWAASGGNGTNPFITSTLFNSYFTPHANLAGLTMLDLVSSGGGADPVRKAARDVVAAYLNASFGFAGFGFTPAQVAQMWTDAVNGVITFESLHATLSAANDPTPGPDCPIIVTDVSPAGVLNVGWSLRGRSIWFG